jgi:hypothetical protein
LKETQNSMFQTMQQVLASQQNHTTILNGINSTINQIRDKDKISMKQKIMNVISMGIVT